VLLAGKWGQTTAATILSVVVIVAFLAYWCWDWLSQRRLLPKEPFSAERIHHDIQRRIRCRRVFDFALGVITALVITIPTQIYIYGQTYKPTITIVEAREIRPVFDEHGGNPSYVGGVDLILQNTGKADAYNMYMRWADARLELPDKVEIQDNIATTDRIQPSQKVIAHLRFNEELIRAVHIPRDEWLVFLHISYTRTASPQAKRFRDDKWFTYTWGGQSVGLVSPSNVAKFDIFRAAVQKAYSDNDTQSAGVTK
jgi:hypothetical protein